MPSHRSRAVAKRFGATLKYERQNRGLSQGDLARLAGIDQTAISRLESGIREPRLVTICSLANALEVTPAELISDLG